MKILWFITFDEGHHFGRKDCVCHEGEKMARVLKVGCEMDGPKDAKDKWFDQAVLFLFFKFTSG